MTHGVAATSGHLANNGGIRGHSAGPVFPFVIYAQGEFGALSYWILQPNGLRIGGFTTWEKAEGFATRLKMFGQLDPDATTTPAIMAAAVAEESYTYYLDAPDGLDSTWRWRVRTGADADDRAEMIHPGLNGEWKSSSYTNREVRTDASFRSIGSDPQWQ
ncbi:hypothetical protein Micant_00012 [Erwinia phage Micant]|uniref:Uncharacterized protein n=1 Tax=Erwinia phage Micant TaxID=2923255 RepID=A0AAE9FS64_9CAUD|nr:hypothetical protein Micant_00012 [Erwinia phage Micant]